MPENMPSGISTEKILSKEHPLYEIQKRVIELLETLDYGTHVIVCSPYEIEKLESQLFALDELTAEIYHYASNIYFNLDLETHTAKLDEKACNTILSIEAFEEHEAELTRQFLEVYPSEKEYYATMGMSILEHDEALAYYGLNM